MKNYQIDFIRYKRGEKGKIRKRKHKVSAYVAYKSRDIMLLYIDLPFRFELCGTGGKENESIVYIGNEEDITGELILSRTKNWILWSHNISKTALVVTMVKGNVVWKD